MGSRTLPIIAACAALLISGVVAVSSAPVAGAASAPVVLTVNPGSGPAEGGNVVTLTGSGFTSSSKVFFGSVVSPRVRFDSASKLYARAPAHAVGTVHVRVVTSAGQSSATDVNRYVFTIAPEPILPGEHVTLLPDGAIQSISCPSAQFCAVLDAYGWVRTLVGTTWTPAVRVFPNSTFDWSADVSCPSALSCTAVSQYKASRFNGTSWSQPVTIAGRRVLAVSCPSASFCIAITKLHSVAYSNGHWHTPRRIVPNEWLYRFASLEDVSCSSSTFCYAVGDNSTETLRGMAIRYDGTWGAPHHVGSTSGGGGFRAVDCVSRRFCMVAADFHVKVQTYTGASFSRRTTIGSEVLAGLSCVTARFCAVIPGPTDEYTLVTSSSVVVDGAAVSTETPLSGDLYGPFGAGDVSCWDVGQCMVSDRTGVRPLS